GWDLLSHNVTHLRSFFDLFTPELAPSWLVPASAFLALIAVLVTRRAAMYLAPAVGALALLLWGITTPKADPFASLGKFLPQGRLLRRPRPMLTTMSRTPARLDNGQTGQIG